MAFLCPWLAIGCYLEAEHVLMLHSPLTPRLRAIRDQGPSIHVEVLCGDSILPEDLDSPRRSVPLEESHLKHVGELGKAKFHTSRPEPQDGRESLHVLLNGVRGVYIESDGLPRQSFYENLHD